MAQTTKEQRTRIKELAVRAYEAETGTSLNHQRYNRYVADNGAKVVIKTSNDCSLLSNARGGEEEWTNPDAPLGIEDCDFVVFAPMYHKPDTLSPIIYKIPANTVVDRMKKGHKQWQNGEPKGDSRRALYFRDAPGAADEAQGTYSYQDKFAKYRIKPEIIEQVAAIVDDGRVSTDTGEDPGNAVILLDDQKDYRVAEGAASLLDNLRELQKIGKFTTYSEVWENLYADLRFNYPILMKVMDLAGRKHYEESGDIGLLTLIRRDDGVLPDGFLDWAGKVRVR